MKTTFFHFDRFGRNRTVIFGSVILLVIVSCFAVFWFFHSAPPTTLIITAGPEGSSLWHYAEEYQKILKSDGVKLVILPSEGSIENFKRLSVLSNKVDIGFVQGGYRVPILKNWYLWAASLMNRYIFFTEARSLSN